MQNFKAFQDEGCVVDQQFACSRDLQAPVVPDEQAGAERILECSEPFARG
ncbi:hypothetical protein [Variovorax sp. WS11]|nr:hypothetical protein [Variovorax sp. WS11]